jgi:uncharacterized membrane protein
VRPIRWFEIVLLITFLSIISALIIPSDSPLPLLGIRFFFGFVFVAFVPGYCLVNILFVNENRLDLSEEVVLSVALSFGIAGLTGLFLGLSPIGINFTSITVSLSTIVVVLSLWAFLRKRKGELREPQVQSADSISK